MKIKRIAAKVTMCNKASGSSSKSIKSSGKSIHVADHNGDLFLEQLDAGVSGAIVVMICRMWDVNAVSGRYLSTDFVVSDARGKAMHCYARSNIAHNFVGLKEGGVYSIKNFIVHPNKDEYRIIGRIHSFLNLMGPQSLEKFPSTLRPLSDILLSLRILMKLNLRTINI